MIRLIRYRRRVHWGRLFEEIAQAMGFLVALGLILAAIERWVMLP